MFRLAPPAIVENALHSLKEIEELLRFSSVAGHVDRATVLLTAIARAAPSGEIANLAMKVISEAHALRSCELPLQPSYGRLNGALWRLRLALQQASSDARRGA
jgi:hypothetical protein